MAGSRDDGTFADDQAHHPKRKVSRADAIARDLQGMLEGRVAPTKNLNDLGTGGCSRCKGSGVDPWGEGMFVCRNCKGW